MIILPAIDIKQITWKLPKVLKLPAHPGFTW